MMRRAGVTAVLMCLSLSQPVWSDVARCDGLDVTVRDAGPDLGAICQSLTQAAQDLASCGGLAWHESLEITVVPELPQACLGIFHCSENRIEVMRPADYSGASLFSDGHPFNTIPAEDFFDSLIRHELVHAALVDMPCAFDGCPVGQEFIAYALQIAFLPDDSRALFATPPGAAPMPRERLNAITLAMAPDIFAVNAWQYFSERPDPCGFVGSVARGEVVLDFEQF